jgi:heptaprenyl diphosphate synthase
VLLYAIYMLGVKETLILMLLKALMSWVIYTNLNAMLYSLAGGVLSVASMLLLYRVKGISAIGVSAVGAVFFNVGQIMMAVLMLRTPGLLFTYLPVLMVSGVITGVLTGVVAQMVMQHLRVLNKQIK